MEWQNLLACLVCNLNSQVLEKSITREDELMSYLWAAQNMTKLVSLWLLDHYDKRDCKSISKANMFKTTGNKEFQAKDYIESVQSYTKCALYAPVNSSELPVAIANRSASLFYLNRYDECIKDIELAIKLNYSKNLHYKLYLRAAHCYSKLGEGKLAEETVSKIHRIMNDPEYVALSIKDSVEKRISEITLTETSANCAHNNTKNTNGLLKFKSDMFDENPNFLYASVSVEKKYDKELGRYVVANRCIKRGEILFLEKPISFVLLDHDASNQLCSYCNSLNTDVVIPCTTCLNTLYCDTKCSDEAWSFYHRWECPGSQMALWREIGIGHLALKVLLTCTTMTDEIKFNEMQNLVTNFDKHSIEDLMVYGITAVMLTMYLSEYTDYFKITDLNDCLINKFRDNTFNFNFNILTDSDKQLYVSSLILRYILQLICNGHAITNSNTLQQEIVATGIYPSASMMNHSCDPNIINIFMDQYLIVRASKDIAKDEEVFNSYGPHYRHMSIDQRQKILKNQYCFTCKCKPCVLPDLKYVVERFNSMICLKCNGALCNIGNVLRCLDCDNRPEIHYQSKLKQADEFFRAAQTSMDAGHTKDALDKLKKCLCIRKALLNKYNEDTLIALILMENIYTSEGRLADSIACKEETIEVIADRFGSFSMELLNELNKLTDIYIMYLQEEPNATTDKHKSMLKKIHRYLEQLEEIADFNYGSWSKVYENIQMKREKVISIV